MKVISSLTIKGGVAKTTTSVTLASILAKAGNKILYIDLDPQGNSTRVLGGTSTRQAAGIFNDRDDISSYIVPSDYEGVDIIPADKSLSKVIYDLHDRAKECDISELLHKKIQKLNYDYIIIDNSPFDSELTMQSVGASDLVLAPIDVDSYSYDGLIDLFSRITETSGKVGREIDFKVFMACVNNRTNVFNSLKEQYTEALEDNFCTVAIRRDNSVIEASTACVPLPEYSPRCNAMDDYLELTRSVLGFSAKQMEKIKSAIQKR